MASAELILRCQYEGGQRHVLKGLLQSSLVKDLHEKIFLITEVPVHLQRILSGFPPKELNLRNENALLSSIGIKSGDTIIVEKKRQLLAAISDSEVVLTRKVIPADNSCLFASISYVVLGSTSFHGDLRDLIVQTVSKDPVHFNEAFLGKSNTDYCNWIANPERWGGAIEISILSKYYQIEIDVVNTESGRIDRFGETENYSTRVFLIYDGIHYDPLEVINSDTSSMQTVFDINDNSWMAAAHNVANEARKMNQFTNVNKFQLRCLTCRELFTGQVEAHKHANKTGHDRFGEIET